MTPDAHSLALVGVRMAGLREVVNDQTLEVLRLLADRRRHIGVDHTRMVCQMNGLSYAGVARPRPALG